MEKVEKKVQVATFKNSKEARLKELENTKQIYEKKGYVFKEYIDDGMTNSYAIFLVDKQTLKKDNKKKYIGWTVALVVLFIIFMPSETNYSNNKDMSLKEAKQLKLSELKEISYSFVQEKELPNTYNAAFYNCLGNLIHEKLETYTIEKMLGWCYNDYKKSPDNMPIYYNTAELLNDFNPYDGSYYPLETYVKNILMNNPSSYEHVKTGHRFVYYGTQRPHMFLISQIRGKNSFGTIVTNRVFAKVDAITKELYDIELE